jgi:hypothetical protein
VVRRYPLNHVDEMQTDFVDDGHHDTSTTVSQDGED